MPHRRRRLAALLAGLAAHASACSSQPATSPVTTPGAAAPSTPTTAALADGPIYPTQFFSMPLDVTVPTAFAVTPDEDSEHFVTFGATDQSRAIRILDPVSLYLPGAATASPLPADYLGFLDGLAANGATLTDREDVLVDGHAATVLTGRASEALDGVLGCPQPNLAAGDCFGLQPDLVLRIAIVSTDDGPLLIWLRLPADPAPDMATEDAAFDSFLDGVRFAARAPSTEAAPVDTRLDGTYQWTITEEAAAAFGPIAPDEQRTYPWTFTITLDHGTGHLHVGFSGGAPPEDYASTFELVGDTITFHEGGSTKSATVVQDPDGTLHLTPIGTPTGGDAFVSTSQPWTKLP